MRLLQVVLTSLVLAGLVPCCPGHAAEAGTAADSPLPGADEVIARYVTALGGKDALQKVNRRVITGEAESSLFKGKARWGYVASAPDRRVSVLEVPNVGALMDGFDGTVAWRKSGTQPAVTLGGEELAKAKRDAQFHRDSNLKLIYPDLRTTGASVLDGEPCFILEAKPSTNAVERFWFSQKSGFLVRQESEFTTPAGRVSSSATYGDFRPVDGIRMPYLMKVHATGAGTGGREVDFTMRFLEVRHNLAVDEARFSKPGP